MAPPRPANDTILVSADSARDFTARLLRVAAPTIPAAHAATIAKHLVAADLRGTETHGILRLPSYLGRIRSGAIDASAVPRIIPLALHSIPSDGPVALVDGCNAPGAVVADMAMREAIARAQKHGVGLVVARRSNHFGASASFVELAVAQGYACLVFTNSSPAMAAWGGRDAVVGVSPIAGGAPGGTGPGEVPLVIDLAPSVAARGKVHKALRRGEQIPLDWGLDKDGRKTQDPAAVLDGGVMLPMGGPKGSALALLMDVFAGVLTGAAYAGRVVGPYDTRVQPANVGHFFVVVRPDLFLEGGLAEFRRRMGVLYHSIVGSRKMEGIDRIYLPGEIELEESRRRAHDGIPYRLSEVAALNAEADRVGMARLAVLTFQSKL